MIDASTRLQFFRYAVVGVGSNLLLYACYLALTMSGLGHKLSMTIAYALGVIISFALNRNWSFGHMGSAHRALFRYLSAYFIGYLLNLSILFIGVDYLHFPHQAIQAMAIVIVATVLFIMHKLWVFSPDDHRSMA